MEVIEDNFDLMDMKTTNLYLIMIKSIILLVLIASYVDASFLKGNKKVGGIPQNNYPIRAPGTA